MRRPAWTPDQWRLRDVDDAGITLSRRTRRVLVPWSDVRVVVDAYRRSMGSVRIVTWSNESYWLAPLRSRVRWFRSRTPAGLWRDERLIAGHVWPERLRPALRRLLRRR
jgi:hypothetical protein